MRYQRPQFKSVRGPSTRSPFDAAIGTAAKALGGWLALTIGLMTAAGALPATVNKVCRTTHRPFRTAGVAAVRVGPRVDVIEPRGHGDLDATIAPVTLSPGVLSLGTLSPAAISPVTLTGVTPDSVTPITPTSDGRDGRAGAAVVAAREADVDTGNGRVPRGLPYRAAPIVARADVIRPRGPLTLTHASTRARGAAQPASYFPPHYNRPPPSAS